MKIYYTTCNFLLYSKEYVFKNSKKEKKTYKADDFKTIEKIYLNIKQF